VAKHTAWFFVYSIQASTSNSDLSDMEKTLLAYAKMKGAKMDKRRLKEDVEAMFIMESGITIKMNKAQREFKDLYNGNRLAPAYYSH
jgi:hypothetical protein